MADTGAWPRDIELRWVETEFLWLTWDQARADVGRLLALLKEHDERIKQLEREATSVARSGGEQL